MVKKKIEMAGKTIVRLVVWGGKRKLEKGPSVR
jgi:hypothetical protein